FRDVIADVDVAPRNVAGRARIYVGGRERARRPRQADGPRRRASAHLADPHMRNEFALFLCGGDDLGVKHEMLVGGERQHAKEQQQGADPERSPEPPFFARAPPGRPGLSGAARGFSSVAILDPWESFVLTHCGSSAKTPCAG